FQFRTFYDLPSQDERRELVAELPPEPVPRANERDLVLPQADRADAEDGPAGGQAGQTVPHGACDGLELMRQRHHRNVDRHALGGGVIAQVRLDMPRGADETMSPAERGVEP